MKPPKEKAKELFDKFISLEVNSEEMFNPWIDYYLAKQCALICVEEILSLFINECEDTRYWKEVKSEIEKL